MSGVQCKMCFYQKCDVNTCKSCLSKLHLFYTTAIVHLLLNYTKGIVHITSHVEFTNH